MKVDKEEMKANRKADQQKMERQISSLACKMNANQERIEAIVHSIRSEQDGKIQRQIEKIMERQEIPKEGAPVASLECKEQGPKELESRAERQMVPTKEAAVKFSRVMKKWHRGQHMAAGQRVTPTKLTRGDCESRKKLVAACRKVSHRATVAWRKRTIFGDIRTQGNCRPREVVTAAGKIMTLHAELA
jgi:hypothetical protein